MFVYCYLSYLVLMAINDILKKMESCDIIVKNLRVRIWKCVNRTLSDDLNLFDIIFGVGHRLDVSKDAGNIKTILCLALLK